MKFFEYLSKEKEKKKKKKKHIEYPPEGHDANTYNRPWDTYVPIYPNVSQPAGGPVYGTGPIIS